MLEIYPKKMKTLIQKDIVPQGSKHHYLYCQDMETTCVNLIFGSIFFSLLI